MKSKSYVSIQILLSIVLFTVAPESLAQDSQWELPFIKVKSNAPNILWITTDQQRWDTIGALGNPYVHTPNIDRLVREGVSFTKAYVQSPVCTPSRASMLTGMYPSTIRATKNGAAYWPDTASLITKVLSDAGYDAGLAGKLHLSTAQAHNPEKRPDDGYRVFHYSHSPYQGGSANDYLMWFRKKGINILALKEKYGYVPTEYHQTTWVTDRAIDFIKERREQPWLFSLNPYDPHGPFDPPHEFLDKYDTDNLPGPAFKPSDIEEKGVFSNVMFQGSVPQEYDERTNKIRQAKYWAQIDLIDQNIGRILKVLEETGQINNTLIIFTSDHGEMLGDHGLTGKGARFYEGLVRVPLIFWYPPLFEKNLQSDALVELIDIVPTLLELTGLSIPDRIQGKSLLPILTGKKQPNHHKDLVRSVFYEAGMMRSPQQKYNFSTMLRTERYKLVVYHGHEKGELFDLKNDPHEFDNLWDNPEYRDVRFELMKKSFNQTVFSIDTGPKRIGRY